MMGFCQTLDSNEIADIQFQPCSKLSSPWFDLRVFYVRISHFVVDDCTPEFLTLNHIPLNSDTLLEVNGVRCSIYSDGISSLLRRDRVDKKSEEATFVSTDCIRFTGSVKFEVFDRDDLVLTGDLEELKDGVGTWSLNCDTKMASGSGFLKGNRSGRHEYALPTIEVYVAGCFSGAPIILTKTLQLTFRKRHNRKCMLDAIPEFEMNGSPNDDKIPQNTASGADLQVAEYKDYKPDDNVYWRTPDYHYMEGEDGELSWFNAGVRVGVGIGLGVCLGIGVGVGLLVRTYVSTTRSFRRRLI